MDPPRYTTSKGVQIMHEVVRAATVAGMLALTAVAPLRAAHADAFNGSQVIGHVYVNDNTAGTNTVAAFEQHLDGSLTPVPSSPFAVGGAGLGAGLGSQGSLQVSPDGRFLLAVDAGSNQI